MNIAEQTAVLVEGRRLPRKLFHALYEGAPPGTRAELIGGVVHMPSPVGLDHSRGTSLLGIWAGMYRRRLPGVESLDNVSIALDDRNELQPDVVLRVRPEFGGRSRDEGGIVQGPPELVVEVARSSRYIDLGPKLAEYERAGVREYVVHALVPNEIYWHVRQDDHFVPVGPDAEGLYRSRVFPGLWLDPQALFSGNLDTLLTALERGLASPEHAAFAERLAAHEPRRPRDAPPTTEESR